jgi:hypothetical protein
MVASLAPGRPRRACPWTAAIVWVPGLKWFRVAVGRSNVVRYLTPDQLVVWLVDELAGRRVIVALPVPAPQGSEDGPFLVVIAR